MQKSSRNVKTVQECRSRVGMQKPSRNAEAEWNAEVGQACGRCAGAESAGALGARSVRENGSCGGIRKQAAKAVSRRCAGLFAGNRDGKRSVQKRSLRPRSGVFQDRVSMKGSASPMCRLRGMRRRFFVAALGAGSAPAGCRPAPLRTLDGRSGEGRFRLLTAPGGPRSVKGFSERGSPSSAAARKKRSPD